MPRYYFDTDDGEHFIEGQEPFDLYGLKEARLQAQAASQISLAIMSQATVINAP
jgi:hypothetical protein